MQQLHASDGPEPSANSPASVHACRGRTPLRVHRPHLRVPQESVRITRALSVCRLAQTGGGANVQDPRFDKITKLMADIFKMVCKHSVVFLAQNPRF